MVAAAGRPELVHWLEELRRSGLVKRLQPDPQRARTLLGHLASVVSALPADGEPLGRFAARHTGSAHALDHGKPLATLALGAARALARLPPPRDGESPAESRREAWAAVGLLRGELSTVVLSLGLPGDCGSVAGRILAAARADGEPVALTLRQLVRDPPTWDRTMRSAQVWICENPMVLALAADRLGHRCPPLVCTSGQPGAAVMTLLRGLAAAARTYFTTATSTGAASGSATCFMPGCRSPHGASRSGRTTVPSRHIPDHVCAGAGRRGLGSAAVRRHAADGASGGRRVGGGRSAR